MCLIRSWPVLLLLITPATHATTLNELIEKHGKQPILDSIFKKSGKRAHIKTEDGIKLFNLPNPEFTDEKTLQRDLAMFNLTPDQIEQDILATQQQKTAEKQQIQSEQAHYASLPPDPPPPVIIIPSPHSTPHSTPYYPRQSPIYIPHYHNSFRRSYRRSTRRH